MKSGKLIPVMMALFYTFTYIYAYAAEDVGTAAKNTASDVDTSAKKSARWSKRQGRKATGNDSATQDAEDRAANVKDDTKNSATKAKNKAQENE